MIRRVSLTLLATLAVVTTCFGQQWADNMFKVKDWDFGSVARGAKAEYKFVFENLYLEDVHIADAYPSCHCTDVHIENPWIKTYQKGAIIASLNTNAFYGQRGATITVVIDRPYYAVVQLHDRGNIRTDVVVDPGSIELGSLDQGTGADRGVNVAYAGRGDWRIVDVRSSNPNITAKAVETGRGFGQVSYRLNVHLDKSAPAGYLQDHLMLVTNDQNGYQIPVLVEGRVTPGITVSPASLFMGVVQPGQEVTRQMVVKGKTPFRILSISCDDKSFRFDMPKGNAAKDLHMIPVTFVAGTEPGKVQKTIKIITDQGQSTPELAAYAVVAAAQ